MNQLKFIFKSNFTLISIFKDYTYVSKLQDVDKPNFDTFDRMDDINISACYESDKKVNQRAVYTAEQVRKLEEAFEEHRFEKRISKNDHEKLSKDIGLSVKQVQKWISNRRMFEKRTAE